MGSMRPRVDAKSKARMTFPTGFRGRWKEDRLPAGFCIFFFLEEGKERISFLFFSFSPQSSPSFDHPPLPFSSFLSFSFLFPLFLRFVSCFFSFSFFFFYSSSTPLFSPPLPYAPFSSLSHSKAHLLFIFSSLKTWGKRGIMVVWGTLCPPLFFYYIYIFIFLTFYSTLN